jgi:hypothetical protein
MYTQKLSISDFRTIAIQPTLTCKKKKNHLYNNIPNSPTLPPFFVVSPRVSAQVA